MALPPSVDGISAATPEPSQQAPTPKSGPSFSDEKKVVKRMRTILLVLIGIPYTIYMGWCVFLLAVLPDRTGGWDSLIQPGKLSALVGAVTLFLVALYAGNRVSKAKNAGGTVRVGGLIRIILFALPGLIVSGLVSTMIGGEPALRLVMQNDPAIELVAPLTIDFSAVEATEILERRGLKTVSIAWDFQGDGVADDTTIVPTATALYDRQGIYNVVATMKLNDNTVRTLRTRISIPKAVFSYKPAEPIVDQPVFFSIEHLLNETDAIREVRWDFDADGVADVTSKERGVSHAFLRTGPQEVTVTIQFENQTQQRYSKVIEVTEPKPLPFPVTVDTVPEFLESPPPFQVIFSVNTEEPIRDVVWDFGDGDQGSGERVGHTFRNRGVFQVTAEIRSQSGEIARVSKVVKLANTLTISDLTFDGSHPVQGNRITVEAPVTIELTPKTGLALVDFFWEAPKASGVEFIDSTVKATYRESGVYTLLLVGKDPEGSVMRLPISVNVTPVTSSINFDMNPDQGVAPLAVEFDASESRVPNEVITGFVWNFGDGNSESERLDSAKVTHTFTRPGTYEVHLSVFTTSGKEFTATKTIVVRAPFLDACFLVSRQEGPAPLGIRFDRSCSTGDAVSVLWDFGDGSQSDDFNNTVDHVFETANKNYNVVLKLTDKNGIISTFNTTVSTR